jgi:hypothetical protein
VIATTFLAPPFLRIAFKGSEGDTAAAKADPAA